MPSVPPITITVREHQNIKSGDHTHVNLLIERVVLLSDGVDIVWRKVGWKELAGELAPETLGGEMLEAEEAQ